MPIYSPNAFEFLNQSENLDLGVHRVRGRLHRPCELKLARIPAGETPPETKPTWDKGRNGFSMKVQPSPRPEKVDRVVIDGHVIPNHVLFTTPTPHNVPYETLAFTDNVKVTVSFLKEHDKGEQLLKNPVG
ncbi:hypothetical protein K0M31_007298 [Melipona bicolor]|uniref:Uncharacterized protein n=1 Tax=Melipona bicolor TaxID=60889 RepID=A0AA40GB57_9HYME|nr:hypothetical protein K0M31_007298 [Melipona bicolor]